MTPYYIYFGFCTFLYLIHFFNIKNLKIDKLISFILLVFIISFTGLRYEVGSDWQNYLYMYIFNSPIYVADIIIARDIGYSLLINIFNFFKLDYVIFNLFLSFISIIPVFILSKNNPNWFIGVFMAIPYFFTICVMGYVRQGVAIGIGFLLVYCVINNKKYSFIFLIIFAISIHKAAIALLPLFFLFFIDDKILSFFSKTKNIIFFISFLLFIVLAFFLLIYLQDQWAIVYHYIKIEKSSQGALLRSINYLIPAILFILFYKKMQITGKLKIICSLFSIATFFAFMLIFFGMISSTFVDRFSLFFIIFSVLIFPRVYLIFQNKFHQNLVNLNLIIYNFVIMFVWMHFSVNGHHMKYNFVPFEKIILLNYF